MGKWAATADPDRFSDAIDWFSKRTVITSKQASALDTTLRADAFWIGGGLQLDQVQRVFDQLRTAIEKGKSFDDFRKEVRNELKNPVHAETVFRNATQRAYNAGRYAQMTAPDVLKFRPFWMFDAILDGRTTPICRACHGVILPSDAAWWGSHVPPLHHRCRASLRNLRKAEAERRGGQTPTPSALPVPSGWGAAPVKRKPPKPSPKKKDPKLVRALKKKRPTARVRVPKTPKEHTPAHWEAHYTKTYGPDAAKAVGWGRAAMERGLDMPLKDVLAQLDKMKSAQVGGVQIALFDIENLHKKYGDKATLRQYGGELDGMLRAGSAIAGHLDLLPARKAAPLRQPDIEKHQLGKETLDFFSKMTPDRTAHPTAMTFKLGTSRAYFSAQNREIAWRADKGILEHEWGHALEELNPALAARAQAYFKVRTAGEKLQKLSQLTGSNFYGPGEVAKPDGFLSAYMGKEYAIGARLYATEITSMGVELLVCGTRGWATLREMLEKDQDTFLFTLGQLGHP